MNDLIYDHIAQGQGYKNTKDMLSDLYTTKNMSQGVIANLIGCSLPTVKSLRQQHGIEDKPKTLLPRPTIPRKELIKKSCLELAAKYKVSKSYIWRLKRSTKTLVPGSHTLYEEV